MTPTQKDFAAAEKKALAVGAKKFFLEVIIPFEFHDDAKEYFLVGFEARICYRTHLPRCSGQLYL